MTNDPSKLSTEPSFGASDPADPSNDRPQEWSKLPTEQRHERSRGLDELAAEDLVRLLIEEDRKGLEVTLRLAAPIAGVAKTVADVLANGGRVLFVGAGTSGRLGVIEAAECPPTFGTEPESIRAVIAGGDGAVFRAVEGAEDDAEAGRAAVRELGVGDLCIAISASSVTPFPRAALDAARQGGVTTVLLTCASLQADPTLSTLADQVLALDTGPEILSGSTRLKAGSATKAVLNAITTTAMVRLGKVYDNLMVDLRPGSAKLRDRAVRITAQAIGCDIERATQLLTLADGQVKRAIVMGCLQIDAKQAERLLEGASHDVRLALARRDPDSPR